MDLSLKLKDIISSFLGKEKTFKYIIVISLIYFILFSYIGIIRYYNFNYYLDFGAYLQAIYTTAFHGKLLYENFDAATIFLREGTPYFGSYLGIHFSPVLLLFVPIFRLFPFPETLIVIKVLAISLSIVFAYKVALRYVGKENLAFLVTVLYTLHPALHSLTLFDFQPQAFFPMLIFLAFYLLLKKRTYFFIIMLILALATNEFMSVLIGSLALVELIFRQRSDKSIFLERKYAAMTLTIAISWYFLASLVMPLFKPRVFSPWSSLFSGEVIEALAFGFLEKISYFLMIVLPFGFLPLRSTYFLALLPYLGSVFTSTYAGLFQLGWHYGSYFLPLMFFSLIDYFVKPLKIKITKVFIGIVVIISVLLSPLNPLTIGNIPGAAYDPKPFNEKHVNYISKIFRLIPENASILVQTPLSQHLAMNINAYTWVPNLQKFNIEYILADMKHIDFKVYGYNKLIPDVLSNGSYGLYAFVDGIVLLKKGYKSDPVIYIPYKEVFRYAGLIGGKLRISAGNIILGDSRPVIDFSSKNKVVILCKGSSEGPIDVAWYGPYVFLTPGTYNVTFRIKVKGPLYLREQIIRLDISSNKGSKIYVVKTVTPDDIKVVDQWVNITLTFTLENYVNDIEFRGLNVGKYDVYLDYIYVEQVKLKI